MVLPGRGGCLFRWICYNYHMDPKKTHILGCKIDLLSRLEIRRLFSSWLSGKRFHHVVTLNPEICLHARKEYAFTKLLKKAELTVADGIGLRLGAMLLASKLPPRITGREIVSDLCRLAVNEGKKVYLVGGGEGVARAAGEELQRKFKGLNIVGAEEGVKKGNFSLETPQLLERINQSGADILFVAFGAPKQEKWIAANRDQLKSVKIAVGIGGIFDYIAGIVPSPPMFVRKVGFEWLYRLFTQPSRWKRIFNATFVFIVAVIHWKLRMCFIYRKNVIGFIQNNQGQVLLVSPAWSVSIKKWQFPQGGIDQGEDAEQAIIREMSEELGTEKLKITDHFSSVYRYKWPKWYRLLRGYKGQKQDLFILEFTGEDKDIDITKEGELAAWQWCPPNKVMQTLSMSRKEIGEIALSLVKQ